VAKSQNENPKLKKFKRGLKIILENQKIYKLKEGNPSNQSLEFLLSIEIKAVFYSLVKR